MARGKQATADQAPVEGLWDLPDGWRWERACDFADIVGGGTPRNASDPKNYDDDGVPWITPADLSGYKKATISRGSRSLSNFGLRNGGGRLMPAGTVLISSRAPVGYCTVAANSCATNQGFKSLVLKDGSNPFFIRYYILRSQKYLQDNASGTTFKELSGGAMAELAFPVPPRSVQDAIVARIDALFAEIAAGEAALAAARAGVETYRKALLKAAVTGELTADWRREQAASGQPQESGQALLARILTDRRTRWHADPKNAKKKYAEPAGPDTDGLPELPEGWVWASLRQIAFISGGATVDKKRKPEYPIEVPYLRVANVQRGALDLSKMKAITIDRSKLADLTLKPGDILLNEGGDRDKVGRGWIWEGQIDVCAHQNHVFKARPVSDVLQPKLVSMYLNELGRKFFLDESKQTTNLASISLTKVARAPVAIPPTDEASAILAAIDVNVDAAIEAPEIERAEEAATALRQSILAAAFRGDLIP